MIGSRCSPLSIPGCDSTSLVPAPKQEQQKKRLLDFVRQSCGDFSLCEEAACRREAVIEIARGSAMAPEDLRFARSSPRTRLSRWRMPESASTRSTGLPIARNRAERPGPGVRRDGLAAAPGTGVWHGGNQTRLRTGGRRKSRLRVQSFSTRPGPAWPKLIVDIVNNHHKNYYAGKDGPGDWESPEMAYFLAVDRDQEFCSRWESKRGDRGGRRGRGPWSGLTVASRRIGFGRKTAAGYGRFVPIAGKPASFGDKRPLRRVRDRLDSGHARLSGGSRPG